jgi:hypothetical protein
MSTRRPLSFRHPPIVLAAAGRPAAFADLDGDGVTVLRQRTGA